MDYGSVHIDVRKEIEEWLEGGPNDTIKSQYVILSNRKKDDSGNEIKCSCLQEEFSSPDTKCLYCRGSGYLYEDSWLRAYLVVLTGGLPAGILEKKFEPVIPLTEPILMAYTFDDVVADERSMIYEVRQTRDGRVYSPVTITGWWNVNVVKTMRLDGNKSEFTTIQAKKNDLRSTAP